MTTEEDHEAEEEKIRILSQGESGESNSTCMICMEEWTIGSEHRLCCLKCGHLFGRSCIERWIKEKGAHAKCPSCNKPAKKVDLRDIWCKAVKAHDTTELAELQKILEQERKLRKTDSAVIFHQNLKLEMLHADLDKLKRGIIERDQKIAKLEAILDRLNQIRAKKLAAGCEQGADGDLECSLAENDNLAIDVDVVQPKELKGMFHFAEKVESSSTGGCKSFALCPTSSIILVAQPAPPGAPNVFGGFGLRKYFAQDTNLREFIPLHSKIITSIQLKPVGDLILTSSQDRRVRLTSISNNICVQSYNCNYEPTCVAWSAHRDQQFYVGSGNCYVSLYDLRNTSECIYQTNRRIANTRLMSIASTAGQDCLNGLLVNDSKGSQFLEVSETSHFDLQDIDRGVDHLKRFELPFDGLMGTVDFRKSSGLALVTTRRSEVMPNSTHNLIKLKKVLEDDGTERVGCERFHTFIGGKCPELLSQSRILGHPTLEDSVLVGACDESARGIKLWDASDNTEYQSIRTDAFVRDMIMFTPENTNQHILYTLSEKGLSIYRWDYA